MKVLHLVSASTLTGPADPALGLARALREELGLDVCIAFDTLREGNMRAKVEASLVPVFPGLQLSTKSAPWRMALDVRTLARSASGFDLLHAHTSHDHGIAVFARGKVPVVRSLHHPRTAMARTGQGVIYRRTSAFAAATEAIRLALLDSYPFLGDIDTELVPGAVDIDRFRPGPDKTGFRAAFGIPKDAFLVGHVSRIKEGRGHAILVEAVRRVSSRSEGSRDFRVAFIGKGEGEAELRRDVVRAGVEGRVSFFGFRDVDLPDAFRACDFTVLLREGNDAGCRAVLESLASGVPVIGAALPSVLHALDGSEAGLTFPVDDTDALVRALDRAMSLSLEDRAHMGERARERILSSFTERGRAERVADLYRRVLSRGGR